MIIHDGDYGRLMYRKKRRFHFTLDEMGEFLAKFSEYSEQVYWISSPDFSKIQYVSPSYETVWGRSREELYKSPEKWLTYFHPEDVIHHNLLEKMAEEIERYGEKARYSASYRIVRPNGEIRWIKDSGFPLINNEGVCYGVTGVAIDVTDEYQKAEALKAAKEAAEAANRAKDEFIRNMSHDIRTPLSGIIGMSSILEKEALTLKEKEHAHMVNISGEQLLTLLNSVLDIIATGNHKENEINQSPVKLRTLIQSIVDLELPTIKLKNLDLRIRLADDLPEIIETDEIKIHRILLNILGNAVKFTEQGYIEIGAKWIRHKTRADQIEVTIRDTGSGITKDDKEKIFKKFFRGTSTYQSIYAGHGVGLHIVKKYIQLLKGKITVESLPNEGTAFTVLIPVKVIEPASSTPISDLPVSLPTTTENNNVVNSGIHILLIEDNAIALKTAENILNQLNIGFQSASNGTRAIELFKNNRFHLVLSDIGLPDISGLQITRQIRAIERESKRMKVPVIGLTAHSIMSTEKEAIESGMNQVISKPLRPEHVQDLIKKYKLDGMNKEILSKETPPTLSAGDLPVNNNELFELEQFALFDEELGIQGCGGIDSLRELLEMLVTSELPLDRQKIQEAYKQQQVADIEKLAHKIKSGAVYLGTTRMKLACQYLESYLKSQDRELVEPLYHQAMKVIDETIAFITQWLK